MIKFFILSFLLISCAHKSLTPNISQITPNQLWCFDASGRVKVSLADKSYTLSYDSVPANNSVIYEFKIPFSQSQQFQFVQNAQGEFSLQGKRKWISMMGKSTAAEKQFALDLLEVWSKAMSVSKQEKLNQLILKDKDGSLLMSLKKSGQLRYSDFSKDNNHFNTIELSSKGASLDFKLSKCLDPKS